MDAFKLDSNIEFESHKSNLCNLYNFSLVDISYNNKSASQLKAEEHLSDYNEKIYSEDNISIETIYYIAYNIIKIRITKSKSKYTK